MIHPETLAIIYGLASALSWGTGDFCGGIATRHASAYRVVIVSQLVGGMFLLGVALALNETLPSADGWLWGGLAGICGGLGLVALYTGLAGGQMGLVAPVAAIVTAILPVMVGIYNEGMPSSWQLAGFGLGLAAVWLLAAADNGRGFRWQTLGLPVAAGIGFGLFFVLIDRVSSEVIVWPLVAARLTSITLLAILATFRGSTAASPTRNMWGMMALAGIFDSGGNAFFALATSLGRLDISAVLSSLYPGATVLLAWLVLKEKLVRQQWLGIMAALAALFCIAN